ncbi:MAG: DegT/DnrJ/EryC1/StrS family aminotransferase [Methanomicrobiales archaeon]
MNVPFFDLTRQYNNIKEEIDQSIQEVVDTQQFILGSVVEEFEEKAAKYCGSKHAVGVASGTDALLLAVRAHNITGDVLTSPFTFFATAGAIHNARASPKFADIDPDSYNLSIAQLEKTIPTLADDLQALMPVHLFGQAADMDPLMELADENDLAVIEDAAQAIGAEYKGKKIGSISTTCFSFFPTKNLGGFGDGGLITTNNEEIAETLKTIRVHGSKPRYFHHVIGYNSRLDALQAAVLNVKLKYLDQWIENRIENVKIYNKALNNLDGVEIPLESDYAKHSYNQYTIRVTDGRRDDLQQFLSDRGIGSSIYYPLCLHMQPCFKPLGYKEGDFKVSELASEEVLSLPIFPELTVEEIEYVIDAVEEFYS